MTDPRPALDGPVSATVVGGLTELPKATWKRLSCAVVVGVSLFLGLMPTAGAYQRPGVTELVSVAADGGPAEDLASPITGGDSRFPSISATGRYVAFESDASNLVENDRNPGLDVFVRDRKKRLNEIVSVRSDGASLAPGGGLLALTGGSAPSISANGRFVTFQSAGSALVDGDTNLVTEVFIRDRKRGATERISVSSTGAQADATSGQPKISGNGRYVIFQSRATNLDERATGEHAQVFLHDRRHKTTTLVSVTSDGTPADGTSAPRSINSNGRYILFSSGARNMGANPLYWDLFVHDGKTGRTEFVAPHPGGIPVPGKITGAVHTSVSADGRFVTFSSDRSDLTPDGGAGTFVIDRRTGRIQKVSVTSTGKPEPRFDDQGLPNSPSAGVLTPDGRFVVFTSLINLGEGEPPHHDGPGDLQHCCQERDLYIHDLRTGATEWLSEQPYGDEYQFSRVSAVSVNSTGRFIAFEDGWSGYVESDTNNDFDVFVRDRGEPIVIGALARMGEATRFLVPGAPGFGRTGIVQIKDGDNDSVLGSSELIDSHLVYRPSLDDLFVRLRLQNLDISQSGIVHGLRFDVEGRAFELRATGGMLQVIGLFDCSGTATGCSEVSRLEGGYGTTGHEVVASIPLRALGIEKGSRISDLKAFTGLGVYTTGVRKLLDEATL